jgi:hypothetical protein
MRSDDDGNRFEYFVLESSISELNMGGFIPLSEDDAKNAKNVNEDRQHTCYICPYRAAKVRLFFYSDSSITTISSCRSTTRQISLDPDTEPQSWLAPGVQGTYECFRFAQMRVENPTTGCTNKVHEYTISGCIGTCQRLKKG